MKNATQLKINEALPCNNFKYIIFVISAVVQSALQVYFAISVKNLINAVEYAKGADGIFYSALVLSGVVILSFLLGVAVKLLSNSLLTQAEFTLKNQIIKSYLGGSYNQIINVSAGDLVSRLEGDVNTVANVKINLFPQVFATAVRLLGTAVALFILQPTFTVIALLVALLIVVCSYFIRKVIYKLHLKTRSEASKQAIGLTQASENAIVIKTFNAENYSADKLSSGFLSYKKAKLNQKNYIATITSTINFIFTAFYALAVIFGAYGIYNGVKGVDFGVITALLQLILQIKSPITSISGFFTAHAEMLVSGDRLFALENGDLLNRENVDGFDKIIFDNVTFSYEGNKVLDGVSFEINKGENLLLKGASGEGKTTIIKLLTGLYVQDSGSIKIIINKKEYAPTEIKNLFAFSPQNSALFFESVKENVVFNQKYDASDFETCINFACISSVIDKLPYKENTVVGGENNLSDGERQRLSIARALYSSKPITVLDEPTSALDKDTEIRLIQNLKEVKNTTFIIISHKPSFDGFGKTINLKSGKII